MATKRSGDEGPLTAKKARGASLADEEMDLLPDDAVSTTFLICSWCSRHRVIVDLDEAAAYAAWERPRLAHIDPATADICTIWSLSFSLLTKCFLSAFQQMEIDHYLAPSPRSNQQLRAVLRLYGVTRDGNSVLAHVHGFLPYFYVPAPPGFTSSHCDVFRHALNGYFPGGAIVDSVTLHMKQSIYGYHGPVKQGFLKVAVTLPKNVSQAKRILETNFTCPGFGSMALQIYESNLEYEVRFMVDRGVVGAGWCTLPAAKYALRQQGSKVSTCQIEADIEWADLRANGIDGEWEALAPLRILSFDIECAGRKGHFPEADKDPVIQIGAHVAIGRVSMSF